MKKIDLKAKKREIFGKRANSLRAAGVIPAVIYGHGVEAASISVDLKEFMSKVGTSITSNVLINLDVDGTPYSVLTHDIQTNVTTDAIIHIDFLNLNMKEPIRTKVHVVLKGVPVGVKEDAGILIHKLREIELKCLPDKIPENIEVDVTSLKIEGSFSVGDLEQKEGVEYLSHANEVIAHVSAPRAEEVVEATTVVAEAAAPVAGATPAPAAAKTAEKQPAKK